MIQAERGPRPNIVFITTDTQGREAIGAYGRAPSADTPNLDRLAAGGTLFENAFTAAPVCTPARSCWFTGLHPNRNGALANDLSFSRGVPSLAELLRAAGYRARHFGKWHLDGGGYNGRGRTDGGFEEPHWYDLSNFLDDVGRDGINRFGGWNRGLTDERFCFAHRVVDHALASLVELVDAREPFFLAVELDEPHGPYICPPPFRGRFRQEEVWRPATFPGTEFLSGKPEMQRNYAHFLAEAGPSQETYPQYYHRYWDANAYADHELGRLLQEIEARCPDDTVVIFTSDHGDHLGSFGLCAKGPTMYDLTTGVPLIIRGPDVAAGRRVACLAAAVDLWATILDYAGVDTAALTTRAGYDGRSLRPVLDGTADAVRDAVFMEFNRFGIHHRQTDGWFPIRCIRTAEWKLAINLTDRDELYHVGEDPLETANLIDDPTLGEIRGDLHDRLQAWQEETQDLLRGPVWGRRPWRADTHHVYEGFFTTGYKDRWESGSFFD